MCLFLRENVSFPLIPSREIRKDCQRQNSWMIFSFLLEEKVACVLPLAGAPTQAKHIKGPHLQVQLGRAVVTNALAKQRYKSAIYIFPYCMDPKHAVPSRSPFLTAYSRSLASPCHFCLSAPSFAPSIVSFPNRWGLKPPLSALFSTASPSCKWGCKMREENSVSGTCTCKYL